MNTADVVPLSLLGAVFGLDVVSFPQAMISRPIVAATAAGALMGSATDGLLAGAVLELIALETLPFGASRYPEWGSAAVVGGALFSSHADGGTGALTLAVLAALATASVGGDSMIAHRKLNGRWARQRIERIAAGSRRTVIGLQAAGFMVDLLRGALITAVALLVLHPILTGAHRTWRMDERVSRAMVVGLAGTVAAAAAWKLFHAVPRARWLFLGGIAFALAVFAAR